jgi:pimeloyl-ACP methyl ester carboxylesterase
MSTNTDGTNAPGHYVPANGLDIYYETYGDGPPLVHLHGGTSTIEHVPAFGARYRVIAPNLRGHGRTANPSGAMSLAHLVQDLAALIAALGLDRPLVVGYSTGGDIALQFATSHPTSARALVVGAAAPRMTPTYFAGVEQMLGLNLNTEPDFDRVMQTHPQLVTYWQQAHAALGGPDYWQTLLVQLWPMFSIPPGYTEADFRRITAPVLLINGDRDETIAVEDAVELYRLIPGAELAVLPGASHLLPPGRGSLYEAVALEFLGRHAVTGDALLA